VKELQQQILSTLPIRESLILNADTEESLLHIIELYVQELIDNDFELLLRTLYRIDVADYKVRKAIDATGPANAAKAIAQLILEREKQKAATRAQFKARESEEDPDWIF
jgi:hypothetical protein